MPIANESGLSKPLRLWPGAIIVAVQWIAAFGLPSLMPEAGAIGAMIALLGGPALFVWWAFFSRAPRLERWGAIVLMILALIATRIILHESIAKGGMGILFFLYAIPVLSLAFVAWAWASRRWVVRTRRAALVATVVIACGLWALLRTTGVTGSGDWDFEWRWGKSHEERLLARAGTVSASPAPRVAEAGRVLEVGESQTGWPGFRGIDRDSVVDGVRIDTDWTASPPEELWRRPIGPGWSSFAVRGDLLYTQEQLGDDEVVSCYKASTGEPVWRHVDPARFWEPQAGAGPRATPILSNGRVFTFGATGILNALDAEDGTVIWSRNATADTGGKVPGWGLASSPLLVGDRVVVHAGALAAYDLATGDHLWSGPTEVSYSSPHLVTLDGVEQILMLSGAGATGVDPADGSSLWEHEWAGGIVQPSLAAGGDVLISGGGMTGGTGIRRVAVENGTSGWTTEERWTSNRLKPNFNDFVVHEGHAFGFDGSILACMDLEDGKRKWKGGRYGNGQLLLLRDQNLLLVLSEQGELALVRATPEKFTELARFAAIEGKTWNHPVLMEDLLLVRNGQEMAAFRLALATG